MLKSSYAVLAILIFSNLLTAQWNSEDGPYGGVGVNSLITQGENIFASVSRIGIIKSEDQGYTWQEKNTGLDGNYTKCFFTENDTLYLGAGNGFYYSEDDGESWAKVDIGITDPDIEAIGRLAGEFYLATDNGILIGSINGSWNLDNAGLTNYYANDFVTEENFIYAATYDGVFKKKSDDTTWTAWSNGIDSSATIQSLEVVGAIFFAGSSTGDIYRSEDMGANWTKLTLSGNEPIIKDFATMYGNIYATTGGGVLISTDNGDTWSSMNDGMPFINSSVAKLCVYDKNLFAAVAGEGIYTSDLGGQHWSECNLGFGNPDIAKMVVLENNLFVLSYFNGIYFRGTNDSQWTRFNERLERKIPEVFLFEDGVYYLGVMDGFYSRGEDQIGWESHTDGLANYTDIVSVISVVKLGDYIFAGTNGVGFYKAHVDTLVWQKMETPFPDNNRVSTMVIRDTTIYATFDAGIGVVKTTDSGITWEAASVEGEIYHAKLYNYESTIYAAGLNGLFSLAENDTNWTNITYNLDDWITQAAFSENGIFVSSLTSVYFLPDNDTNWIDITMDLPVSDSYPVEVFNENVYVGTSGDGLFSLPIAEIITGTETPESELPNHFRLEQNYPNPFNPSTTIQYCIPSVGTGQNLSVKLCIYDILGNEVKVLVDKKQNAGTYQVVFDGRGLSSGVYFYRLATDKGFITKKFVMMK